MRESRISFAALLELSLTVVMAACIVLYLFWTRKWPLVGDSALIHYICFLMDHGMAPYRVTGDMNFPGAFLVEWSVMHSYGGGSVAWRLYDLTLLAVSAAAMLVITWPEDWFAGFWSAVLLIVTHARDGINDTGQRDLTMAALIISGYAFLFLAMRKRHPWAAGAFGCCIGLAATIKPTALPLGLILPLMMLLAPKSESRVARRAFKWGCAGFLLPFAIVLAFLIRERALRAFLHGLVTVDPYYASLARRPIGFLLAHSVSPMMALVIIWLTIVLMRRFAGSSLRTWSENPPGPSWEREVLLFGVLVMLMGFVAQGKGFPYQRYPLLALLLVIIGTEFTCALRSRGIRLWLGILGLCIGSLIIAPRSVAAVRRYDWRNQEFVTMLQRDLGELGGQQLSGHVQCIDSISGCESTLYRMKLVQQTGLLSDFLIFGPKDKAVIRETRSRFITEVELSPPTVIVVTSWLHPSGPDDFQKLNLWPEFESYLAKNYSLCIQRVPPDPVRWWSRVEVPKGYRIYLLRQSWSNDESVCRPPEGDAVNWNRSSGRSRGVANDGLLR